MTMPEKKRNFIQVYLSGGVIQSISAGDDVDPELEVIICDYDIEGSEDEIETRDIDGDVCNIYADMKCRMDEDLQLFYEQFLYG